jgi:tRNA pseudouridine synthase 10
VKVLDVKEKIIEILKVNYVCDRCLGRNFAQLLSGMSNEERGKVLRYYLAMLIESGEKIDVNNSNFYGINFHVKKIEAKKPNECSICSGLFREIKKKAKLAVKKLKKYNYKTFLVGCRLTSELNKKEQESWEMVGIDWCESIKNEINREIGIEIEKMTEKEMDRKSPDITITFDLNTDEVKLDVRPVYVYGKYQKLVRGIPQTKWKKKIFKTSVQEIIEKPFLRQTISVKSSFHGSGREDINVRCLGWRPFVLEIVDPKKRIIRLNESMKEVNKSKKVKVKNLKIVDKEIIKKIKFADYEKVYRAVVEFENPVESLKRVSELKDVFIEQKTPIRVIRRRVDKTRRRKVKDIKYKLLSSKKAEFTIKAQSGLYIKELINGDDGRTQPSVSELIKNKVKKIDLDVIRIYCD